MNLNEEQKVLLEQWLEDQSFINWALQRDEKDASMWEHYFNDHPHHWELAKEGRTLVLGIPFKDIQVDPSSGQEALNRLINRIEDSPSAHIQPLKPQTVSLWKPWTLVASISIFMLFSGLAYFQFFHHTEIMLATTYGQQLETYLPDGSKVTLNANSSLRYNTRNPRRVWLEGEAFFEVKKIPETDEDFQVLTEDLTVNVLGTSFNVNTRNDQTKVFLEEGKVRLKVENPATDFIEMDPGDLIAYSKKQNKLKENQKNASVLENAYWKEGTLIFNDTPLPHALFEIEDIYGIQFVWQSEELKKEIISGGVPIKDLDVTLQTLSEVYGIRIRSEGKRYFIDKKAE
ncbi:MAG: FecR domain-containing protein [Bacteroidia bacterium]|nr:FecR domain-containing protein [Bacteroidia bacterium]